MPSKAVVFGISIVFMIVLFISLVEFFLPISAKSDMDAICRKALLKMELNGGMTKEEKDNLTNALREKGFDAITIESSENVKYGEEISLYVEAYYSYSKLTNMFLRENLGQRMVYSRKSLSRRILN